MSVSLQPLQASKRDTSPDILRGFALAGVLFMFCASKTNWSPGDVKFHLRVRDSSLVKAIGQTLHLQFYCTNLKQSHYPKNLWRLKQPAVF